MYSSHGIKHVLWFQQSNDSGSSELTFPDKKLQVVLSLPLRHTGSESFNTIPLRIPQLFTLAFHHTRFLPCGLFANIFWLWCGKHYVQSSHMLFLISSTTPQGSFPLEMRERKFRTDKEPAPAETEARACLPPQATRVPSYYVFSAGDWAPRSHDIIWWGQ